MLRFIYVDPLQYPMIASGDLSGKREGGPAVELDLNQDKHTRIVSIHRTVTKPDLLKLRPAKLYRPTEMVKTSE